MSFGLTAAQVGLISGGLGAIGSIAGSIFGANAAHDAAQTQAQALQHAQDSAAGYLNPYMQAGQGAMGAQQDMLGLNGGQSQQQAIDGIQNSPMFQSLQKQQMETMASLDAAQGGGIRSGQTQQLLAQQAPQLLQQMLQQRFQNLGSLSSLGGNVAGQLAGNAYGAQQGIGQAQASGQTGAANAVNQGIGGGLGALTGTLQNGLQYGQNQQMMDLYKRFLSGGSGNNLFQGAPLVGMGIAPAARGF